MKLILIGIFSLSVSCLSCNSERSSTQDIQTTESKSQGNLSGSRVSADLHEGRYAWQKPSLVINKLGNLQEKTVADIGAGTGYFTFRLLQRAKKVIAVDIDPNMINLIELFRQNLDSAQQSRVEIRLAQPDDPNLKYEEVDAVVIINTIGYIEDRSSYLKKLQEKIKTGGEIMIVDFKMKHIPEDIAPPSRYRVNLLELEELLSKSGYDVIEADDRSLDYQYIVIAQKK